MNKNGEIQIMSGIYFTVIILVFQGCYNEVSQAGWFETAEINFFFFFTILGARSPKSEYPFKVSKV